MVTCQTCKIVTVEDFSIKQKLGSSYQKGIEIYRGKPKKMYGYREVYKTNAGEFEVGEWRNAVREIIELSGESELLEQIKAHCREQCAWLHKESDIEEYAMECLASRAYRYWKDLEPVSSSKCLIFIF